MKPDEFLLSLFDMINGTRIISSYRELYKNQSESPEFIRNLQMAKLKRLLEHCQLNVPYYKQLFKKIGFSPSDVKSVEDLTMLPTLDRITLEKNGKSLISNLHNVDRMKKCSTGGTSGKPVHFFLDKSVNNYHYAATLRHLRWLNLKFFEKHILLWASPPELSGYASGATKMRSLLARRKFLPSFQLDEEKARQYAEVIQSFRPKIIYGYSSILYDVAKHFVASGNYVPTKYIVACAEPLFDYQRKYIEGRFKSPVLSRYGSNEFSSIAHECPEKNLHINSDRVILEFSPIPSLQFLEGEVREIIVTDLDNYGMPFIRYRINDIAQCNAGSCPCGLPFKTFERINGRINDIIKIDEKRAVAPHFWAGILSEEKGLDGFQIVKGKDRIQVNINCQEYDQRKISERLHREFGDKIPIQVNRVSSISKTPSGKILPVIHRTDQ
jgi:phenylacetate-CoA ligase